jgi:exosortase B
MEPALKRSVSSPADSAVDASQSSMSWARIQGYSWVLLMIAGLVLMYAPVFWGFAETVWATDEQGHGPIVLAISGWLMWRKRAELLALQTPGDYLSGGVALAIGALLYVAGRNQMYDTLEALSLVFVLMGGLLVVNGWPALRLMLFPILFLCFTVPLPGILVQTITTPIKIIVSFVAEWILAWFSLPVARSGVILYVGPYQLLVADACSGLNSLFTLEALGLLYMNLMGYRSTLRNVLLAILIVPVSFCANVCRVIILILVTYYLGDAAGQGFLHSLAGMTLFMIALVLMLAGDLVLGRLLGSGASQRRPGPAAPADA